MARMREKYVAELKRRGKESHVYKKHQLIGLEISKILADEKHKALYIKLAKEHDADMLMRLAKDVAERKNVKNKGAYFMIMLKERKTKTKNNMVPEIVTIAQKKGEKFLRKKTAPFDFKKFTRKEVNDLIVRMRRIMHEANGIGLSANQIGLEFSVFVAEVPDAQSGTKFYAVFNPKIEKASKDGVAFEEGCLSVPDQWGEVTRAEQIIVSGYSKMGKKVKVKAWGLLSRVFQHEIDHLNGKLFIDRAKKLYSSEHA